MGMKVSIRNGWKNLELSTDGGGDAGMGDYGRREKLILCRKYKC